MKKNIKPIENVYEKVLALNPVNYNFTPNRIIELYKFQSEIPAYDTESLNVGFIAQDVKEIFETVVHSEFEEGYYVIEYGLMVSLGVGAVQEQQARIENIYKRINALNEITSG